MGEPRNVSVTISEESIDICTAAAYKNVDTCQTTCHLVVRAKVTLDRATTVDVAKSAEARVKHLVGSRPADYTELAAKITIVCVSEEAPVATIRHMGHRGFGIVRKRYS